MLSWQQDSRNAIKVDMDIPDPDLRIMAWISSLIRQGVQSHITIKARDDQSPEAEYALRRASENWADVVIRVRGKFDLDPQITATQLIDYIMERIRYFDNRGPAPLAELWTEPTHLCEFCWRNGFVRAARWQAESDIIEGLLYVCERHKTALRQDGLRAQFEPVHTMWRWQEIERRPDMQF